MGSTATIFKLSKEYKILGMPFDPAYTDILFDDFKRIPVELLRLKPGSGKKSLAMSMLSSPASFSSAEIKNGGINFCM